MWCGRRKTAQGFVRLRHQTHRGATTDRRSSHFVMSIDAFRLMNTVISGVSRKHAPDEGAAAVFDERYAKIWFNKSKTAEALSRFVFCARFRKSAEHSPKVKRGTRGRRVEEERGRRRKRT
jgi:hypothetical protein